MHKIVDKNRKYLTANHVMQQKHIIIINTQCM